MQSGGGFFAQTNYIGSGTTTGLMNQTCINYSPIMAERKVLLNREKSPGAQNNFIYEQNMLRKQSKTLLHKDTQIEEEYDERLGESLLLKGSKGIKIMLPKLNYPKEPFVNKKESNDYLNAWNNETRDGSNLNYSVSYSLNYSLNHT
jgi:hypothetical protein